MLTLQTSLLLLDDSLQSYLKSNVSNTKLLGNSTINPLSLVDYENSKELTDNSERLLTSIHGIDSNTAAESSLYYDQIRDSLDDKQGSQIILKLINSVKSNHDSILPTETTTLSSNENEIYFKNVNDLLYKTLESVNKGNYPQADRYATEAYLDNYKYLEAPIEKINSTLKNILKIYLISNSA